MATSPWYKRQTSWGSDPAPAPQLDPRAIQLRLKADGYDPGPIDGIWGERSDAAWRAWEAAGRRPRSAVVGAPRPPAPPRSMGGGSWGKNIRSLDSSRQREALARQAATRRWQQERRATGPGSNSWTSAPLSTLRVGQIDSSLPGDVARVRVLDLPSADKGRVLSERRARLSAERSNRSVREDLIASSRFLSGQGDREAARNIQDIAAAWRVADPDEFQSVADDIAEALEEAGFERHKGSWREKPKKKDNSIFGRLKRAGGNVLGTALRAIEYPFEELVQQPFYAGLAARRDGGGLGDVAESFGQALNPFGSTKYEAGTNSRSDRQVLREAGFLPSFGEMLLGDLKIGGSFVNPLDRGGRSIGMSVRASGFADAAFQVVADPLNILSLGAGKLGNLTRVSAEAGERAAARGAGLSLRRWSSTVDDAERVAAQRLGRQQLIEQTATGRAITKHAREALAVAQEPQALRRALGGLSTEDAAAAVAAARRGGVDEGVQVIREAFVEGGWTPRLSVRRQAAARMTGGHLATASRARFLGLGPSALRDPADGGHRWLEAWAGRSKEGLSAAGGIVTPQARRALDQVVTTAARRAKTTPVDAWRSHVAGDVSALSPMERLQRVFESEKVQAAPQAQAIVESQVNAIRGLSLPGQARPSFEALIRSEPAERIIRNLETMEAALDGKLGKAAAKQADAALRRGFTPTPALARGTAGLSARVARNVGETPTQAVGRIATAERSALTDVADIELRELDSQIAMAEEAAVGLKGQPGLSATRAAEHLDNLRSARERLAKMSPEEVERRARLKFKAEERATTLSLSGIGVPVTAKKVTATPANVAFWETRIRGSLPDELSEPFLAELGAMKASDNLAPLARRAEHLIVNPDAMDEALRLVRNDGITAAEAAAVMSSREGVGMAMRRGAADVLRAPAKLALSIAESIPPSAVVFASSGNPAYSANYRVQAVDRWLQAGGANRFTRESIAEIVGQVQTEQSLYDVVDNVLAQFARTEGVNPDVLRTMLAEQKQRLNQGFAGRIDPETGEAIDQVQTLAQRAEQVPLPDWNDVRRVVREARAAQGSVVDRISTRLRSTANFTLPVRGPISGEERRVLDLIESAHRMWKFGVVVGFNPLAIGAGFALSEGDFKDRALAGLAMSGIIGAPRYIFRVAGIEERLIRYPLARGFRPTEWSPVLNQRLRQRGVDIPMQSINHVKSGGQVLNFFDNRLLATTGNEFAKLVQGDRRFIEGWRRVINRQVHPESDYITRVLLAQKAGMAEVATDELAEAAIRDFLATDAGRIHLQRMMGALNGPANADEMIATYRTFIDQHVTSPDLARLRLAAADANEYVAADVLKAEVKAGRAPVEIHAQRSWVVPRNWQDAYTSWRNFTDRAIFSGPTSRLNRVPMAEWIYRDQYLTMTRNGVEPERAARIADEIAVERTNAVMFQVADESRFARRADLIFPFQQPREELIRVYGRLVLSNPGRTARAARLAAVAFNNGKESGVFREDPVTGDYFMTVPGSAFLSRFFGAPTGVPLVFNPQNLFFLNTAAPGTNILPTPGGPAWIVGSRWFIDNHKDWFDRNFDSAVTQYLFPYGQSGRLGRPESARFWMSMFNSPAPWEFASQPEQENELNRMQQTAYRILYAEGIEAGENAETYEPDPEAVDELTKAMMRTWAVVGSIFPATSRLSDPWEQAYREARAKFAVTIDGKEATFDFYAFKEAHPEFGPYLEARTEWLGGDDFDDWVRSGEYEDDARLRDYFLRNRKMLSASQLSQAFRESRDESRLWKGYWDIINQPFTVHRDSNVADFLAKNPDFAEKVRGNYFRNTELRNILALPANRQQDALDAWRRRYNVSAGQYPHLREQVLREGPLSPWGAARPTDQIVDDVSRAHRGGANIEQYVATLLPAEQVRYWTYKRSELGYYTGQDPEKVLDDWNLFGRRISETFSANPALVSGARDDDSELAEAAFRGITRQNINLLYDELSTVYEDINSRKAALTQLAEAKQWTQYWALKARQDDAYDRRTAIYDRIRELNNQQFKQWRTAQDDVRAVYALVPEQYYREWKDKLPGAHGDFFISSNEQKHYLDMTPDVRRAYVDDLVSSLDRQLRDVDGEGTRLHWSYLTDFQRELLRMNLPPEDVNGFENSPTDQQRYEAEKAAGGGGRSGGGRSEWNIDGHTLGSGFGELAWAFEMFKQYDKRGGAGEPAGYQAYLNLPNDPVIRGDFLDKNPSVANYIKLGPMANMPPLYRYMVADIMVRYGRWEGESRTITEVTELAFAREQLARWNMRGDRQRPATYDTWLAMPTGIEKAEYLRLHPEIGEWLKLGPMSNMPDEYQDVVRDIMQRYGEWTEGTDPLAVVIQGYYDTPTYARQQYLEQHPELAAYWAALRGPEEERIFQLSQRYFSLPPSGRRLFMAAHPELGDYFIQQRTKRYERFLNRVAMYMGENPQLFTEYLERQEDVLGELLQKFGEGALLPEVPRLRDENAEQRTRSESGRTRTAA